MIIPAPVAAGAAAPVGPLLTPADYAQVCGSDGPQPVQSDIDEAIASVEEFCTRTLAYGTYTERLFVDRRGFVYPSATPLDASAAIIPQSSLVQGAGIWVGYFTPLPDLPVWTGVVPPQADVTYSGGYHPWGRTAGSTPQIPPRLRRAVLKVCWFALNPAKLTGLPGGVQSTSSAGVAISGRLSSMVDADFQLRSDLKRFMRRDARSW